ncbi:unnamed protein product [Schistocephalus solidus]|uniref:Retrotransposon gag domain-containing protein n=1 Tax=Schistocephalus solidus TaxID=70667 RepID=A0A183TPQ2_SCHSO|nr:unnamed protein product [Schistocephalus solidus]
MKVHLEAVDEGAHPAAILGRLDNEVYTVARAINPTASLTAMTISQRLRREFGRSSRRWVARAALKNRRQHAGESVVDFQRHLRVLARQAYPNELFTELEARILDGISLQEIRRQFLHDPPRSIKVAFDIARREEAIHKACHLVQEASSSSAVDVTKPLPLYRTLQSLSSPWDSDRAATSAPRQLNDSGAFLSQFLLAWLSTTPNSLAWPSAADLYLPRLSTVSSTWELEATTWRSDQSSTFLGCSSEEEESGKCILLSDMLIANV